jgi:ribose transport system permease protein
VTTTEATSTKATGSPTDDSRASVAQRLLGNETVLLLIVYVAVVAYFTSRNSIFFSKDVFANILLDWGPVVLIAVGETFVVISGGIDLSVGATLGFSGVVAAFAMRGLTSDGHGEALVVAAGTLVALVIGAGVGLLNALLINRAKLVPFIATLVTLGAGSGLVIVMTKGAPIAGGSPKAIFLSNPWIGPFSKPVLLVLAVTIVAGLFLHKARFGRYTFAIGSNTFAARAAGINVHRHLMKVYMLSGALAGLAGMFFYLRLGSGAPTSGAGAELDAIAAVVIGGVALSGGIGRMAGTALGALLLTTITSGLIIINVPPDWKKVVVAILIAIAATAQGLTSRSRT